MPNPLDATAYAEARPQPDQTQPPPAANAVDTHANNPAGDDFRLEVRDLECIRNDRILFSGLNFSVGRGHVVQVAGHNGCGKTSLLRILCGLMLPAEGEVLWNGEPIDDVRPEYFAQLSYLGHRTGIKGELTPLENLAFAHSMSAEGTGRDPLDVLRRLSLNGFEDVACHTLSAGQNRRVGLARLLLANAPVWILDEPFTAIDRHGVAELESIFREHVQAGGMIILTTHQPIDLGDHALRTLDLTELAVDP